MKVGSGRGDVPLLFEGGSAVGLGDGELLARFLARRDEAAFEALVARLGPLVLGACRRMLADPHDVDDAFQGTFLVLVRNAGTIRDRDRVGTWTYEVAVRVARRARLDAARRSARERRAASPESSGEPLSIDRAELKAQIDEEIARLPDHHRRAVLLCDVEGLSREEAAARLGWTPNMVRGRLDRARARLRDRLARRGLAPSDAWLTLLTPLPALRAALVLATARAALGHASPAALALSKGVGLMMIFHQWRLAALALAAGSAGLVAATAGPGWVAGPEAPVAQAPGPDVRQAPRPAEPKPRRPLIDLRDRPSNGPFMARKGVQDPNAPRPSMDTAPDSVPVRISGVVRDLAGKPVAGATVHVLGTRSADVPKLSIEKELAGSATTDGEGRFRLPAVALPTSRHRKVPQALTPYVECQVVARAPGFGIGWSRRSAMYAVPLPDPDDIQGSLPFNSPIEADIYLRPEAELKGRVVDEAGRPVAGVVVEDRSINLLDEAGAETTADFNPTWGTLPGRFGRAETDAEGRFRMPGLPAESCVWLSFERPGSTMKNWLYASTSASEPGIVHPEPTSANHNGRGKHPVYPADMTVTMATPRRIDARVMADDDGRPVPDIHLNSIGESLATGIVSGGTSDAEGKVALDLPPGKYVGLYADPAEPDSRYVRTYVRTYLRPFTVAPEPAVQPLAFKMRAGAEIFIEVVDADTGRGIPDVRFDIKAEGKDGTWGRLQSSPQYFMSDGEPSGADGKLRAVLDPARKGARRIRVVGVGLDLPDAPADPAVPPAPGMAPHPLPYEAVEALSEPFEPAPGKPIKLRFRLKKK